MQTSSGIPVEVRKKNIKQMHLYVKPPHGAVVVTAPYFTSAQTIERFVESKASWIEKQAAEIKSRQYQSELAYETGETLFVWGRRYTLQVCYGSKHALKLVGNTALLTTREESTAQQRERFMREWYRAELKAAVERLLPAWEERTGLKATSWQTKYMTSRWGTCNTATSKLWFNVQLAQKAPECLKYVIVHELVHLAEKGHGQRFKALMDQYLPEWRRLRTLLK